MKNALTQLLASAAIAATGASLAAPAHAEQINKASDAFTLRFEYDKSELATEAGQQKLLARMENKVLRQCTPAGQRAPLPNPEVKKCVDNTMRATLGKFNSDSLASLYTSRTAG